MKSADPEFVQSLAKGLRIIEAFGGESPSLALSELARKVGLTPGSTRRMLVTLQQLGYVGSDGQRFFLLPRTLQLGYAYLASLPLASLAQPRLAALSQEIGASCSVAVLDGHDVVYVARAAGTQLPRDYMSVGTRLPAYATSVGKVLLATIDDAALEEIATATRFVQITQFTITEPAALVAAVRQARKAGWAMNDQETVVGLRSIAVPIVLDGHTLAALGASAQTARISMGEMIDRYVPALHRATVSIAEMLRTKNVTQQTLSSLSSPA